jgi:hypothetical protein
MLVWPLIWVLSSSCPPQLPVSLPVRQLKEPEQPVWMSADTCLKTPVSLAAHGRPLRVVLASLSQSAGVTIRAARDIEEYRVTIDCRSMPIGSVMARILDVNGHGKLPAVGYAWYRDIEKGHPSRYLLKRSLKAALEEADLLNGPRKTAVKWLREMRDYCRLAPEKRKGAVSDNKVIQHVSQSGGALDFDGVGPVGEAVGVLSDEQIEALVRNNTVNVPNFQPSATALAAIRNEEPKKGGATQQASPEPTDFSLYIERLGGDGEFDILLRYRTNERREYPIAFGLDTLNLRPGEWDEEAIVEAERKEVGLVVDLMAHEQAPPGKIARTSLISALALFVREAKIPLFSEIYITDPHELRYTQGKPEYLLTRICKEFGCEWCKVGGAYIVHSKTWAQDRAGDVSDPFLNRLAEARTRQGRFELEDYLEISQLNDRQAVTLQKALGSMGPLSPRNRDALRLVAQLSKQQRQTAFGPDGIEIVHPSDQQVFTLQKFLGRKVIEPPFFVHLEQRKSGSGSDGIAIEFADRKGKSGAGAWVYLGPKQGVAEPDPLMIPEKP